MYHVPTFLTINQKNCTNIYMKIVNSYHNKISIINRYYHYCHLL